VKRTLSAPEARKPELARPMTGAAEIWIVSLTP